MSYGPADPPDDLPIQDPDQESEDEIKNAKKWLDKLKREFEEIEDEYNEIKRRAEEKKHEIEVQEARISELEKKRDGTEPPSD